MSKTFDVKAIGIAVFVFACSATVRVVKVTPQNDATAEGFRYYLSRPYMLVKKEFPYDSKDVYLQARIVNIGGTAFVQLNDTDIKRLGLSAEAALVRGDDVVTPHGGGLQGETGKGSDKGSGSGSDDAGKGSGSDGKGSGKGSGSGSGSGDKDASSTESLSSSTSNGLVEVADASFDIAYLPDFDQQYAINVDGKWAQTELKLQIANGWMLQSVDQKIDNSAITSFLTEQAGKTLDVARAFAALKLKLPSGGLQGESGTAVTVRLRALTYVVPGLYPLAKPAEIAIRCARHGDAEHHPVASGASNSQSDCEELFHFHTRTETLLEVLTVPDSGDGKRQDKSADQAAAEQALKGVAVTVVSVEPGKATDAPVVRIKPATGRAADKKPALKTSATNALHKAAAFANAVVLWDDEATPQ